MDEDNNQENRTTDLQESMQKGKSLLNSAKDKGKKISGSKTLHNKSGGNVVEKGAKVRANIERAKGHAKKTKGAVRKVKQTIRFCLQNRIPISLPPVTGGNGLATDCRDKR